MQNSFKTQLSRAEQESEDNNKLERNKLLQELQIHQIELEMQNDELRHANEELEIQRIKFTGIYELAPVGYFILNQSGIIEEVNTAGSVLLEFDKSIIVKRSFQSFIAKDYTGTFCRFFKEIKSQNERKSCQLELITQHKKTLFAQVEGIAIHGMHTNRVDCYIALIDITERKEAVQRLEVTKERLELALEASEAGTWEYDYKTGKILLDESNYHICGIDKYKYKGEYHHFLNAVHSADRFAVDNYFRTCINQEKEINIEFSINKSGKPCVVSMRGHHIKGSDENQRLVGTIMNISEKRRLENEADKFKIEEQRNITTAIINTEETERKRISDSLHDGVCQLLYGIKLNLQQLNGADFKEGPLNNIKSLLELSIKETRNISFELAPSILNDFGLTITIEELGRRLSTDKLAIQTSVKGLNKRLDLSVEISVFRMVQELINNAIKHSEATLIKVEVRKMKGLEIVVVDDGIGFDQTSKRIAIKGMGLSNLKTKVAIYDGLIAINSSLGKGTCVKILLNKLTD